MAMADIKVNEPQLDAQLSLLDQARSWSPRVMSKFETFIRAAPDYDLFRVNPLQYATERSMIEAEGLDLFLHASKIGLFEMDWHIVCPHCGFVIDSLHNMSQLHTPALPVGTQLFQHLAAARVQECLLHRTASASGPPWRW
jgi:hypothetical protein